MSSGKQPLGWSTLGPGLLLLRLLLLLLREAAVGLALSPQADEGML